MDMNDRICFPSASMKDLFSAVTVVSDINNRVYENIPLNWEICPHDQCVGTVITSFCSTHRLRNPPRDSMDRPAYVRVKPTSAVVDIISSRAQAASTWSCLSDYETFSFKLITRNNDSALVVCQSSQIIQTIWLAEVESEDVAEFLSAAESG